MRAAAQDGPVPLDAARTTIRSAVLLLTLAGAGPGCILSAEDCGETFVSKGGRCVPVHEDDAGFRDFGFDPFDLGRDLDGSIVPPLDFGELPPDAASPDEPWAPMFSVLIVDRTPDSLLGESPTTPGCDLDGVRVLGDALDVSATKVLASLRFDPFDQSIGFDESAALGRPEQSGEFGTFVSLGGGGAYQLLYLEPPRPLRAGDHLVVAEYLEPRDFGDLCAVWLCHSDLVDLSACLWVGEGRGGDFVLP